MRLTRFLYLAVVITFLAGCAKHYTAEAQADPYGFFSGLWHGLVFPYSLTTNIISWVLSLFGVELLPNVEIVGRPNTGVFYYVGFFIGLSGYGGVGAASTRNQHVQNSA